MQHYNECTCTYIVGESLYWISQRPATFMNLIRRKSDVGQQKSHRVVGAYPRFSPPGIHRQVSIAAFSRRPYRGESSGRYGTNLWATLSSPQPTSTARPCFLRSFLHAVPRSFRLLRFYGPFLRFPRFFNDTVRRRCRRIRSSRYQ